MKTFPEVKLDVENRLMIGGDSAGGNLTSACIIKLAKDDAEHLVRPLAALPIYPVLQSVTNMIPSMRYNTPMASSTATSMIDLTNKYGNLGSPICFKGFKEILRGPKSETEWDYM